MEQACPANIDLEVEVDELTQMIQEQITLWKIVRGNVHIFCKDLIRWDRQALNMIRKAHQEVSAYLDSLLSL